MRALRDGGFTLIEVMAALAILGVGLYILLDAHYSSLRTHTQIAEAVTTRQLLETAVAKAEVEVMAGLLSGGDTFGERYPDYSWAFDAIQQTDDVEFLLYLVTVTVTGPDGDESLEFWAYNPGLSEGGEGGTGNVEGNTGGRSESGGSGNSSAGRGMFGGRR